MDEAIIDVALDLNPPPSECSVQPGVREDMLTDNRDKVPAPSGVPHDPPTTNQRSEEQRSERVKALRLSIASGTYQVDTADLALCILRNITHYLESR
jgi:hypothetical protein